MRHRLTIMAASAIFASLLAFQCTPAQGQCLDELAERYKKETRTAEINMLEAQQTLKDKDPSEWMPFEIQSFEYYSLWVVYAATLSYVVSNEFKSFPTELRDLESQGYIINWPENPYNDWQPVEILDYTDEFSPGDIAIQRAPAGYRDGKRPNAFEMVIYGPDVDFASYGSTKRFDIQDDWPPIPEGALYLLGSG